MEAVVDRDINISDFLQWEKVLDVIAEGLEMNSITFRRLKSGSKQKKNVKEFKVKTRGIYIVLHLTYSTLPLPSSWILSPQIGTS